MNGQFGILLEAKLDIALSTETLNAQLEQLAKNLKPLNVKVVFDSNSIKNVTSQISDVQKRLSSSGSLRIVDTAQLQRDKAEIFSTIDDAVKKYQQLGQVKIQENFNPITKQIQSFTLTVQEADGVVNKLKYDLASLSDGKTAFVPVKMTTTDNSSVIAEKQLQQQQQINTQLEAEQAKAIAQAETQRQRDLELQAQAEAKQKAQYEKNLADLENFVTQYTAKIKILQSNTKLGRYVDPNSISDFKQQMSILDPASSMFSSDINNLKNQFNNISLDSQVAQSEEAQNQKQQKYAENYENWWNQALKQREAQEQALAQKESEQIAKNQQQLDNFLNQYNSKIKLLQNSPQSKFVDQTALNDFTTSMNALDPKSKTFANDLQNLKDQFNQVSLNARAAKTENDGYAQSLDSLGLKYVAVYEAAYKVVEFFREELQTLIDFNKQLTLISTTANLSQSQVQQLGQQYIQKSAQMGVLAPDMADLAPEFYRQTRDSAQVMANMTQTMQYAKISNLDYADSAKLVTATMNTMHVSAQEATDVFTALGDSVNSSPGELGVAFQKIGAEAYSLGVPFQQTAAMVATLSNQTRESAETVGDSIRSLYSRIESLKQQGFAQDELGNTTDVSQVSKALSSIGVNLVDQQTGQFRNIATVLDEVGRKFSSLDTIHQRYISTTLGGIQQQGRLLALFENWSNVMQNVQTAYNSTGAVTQKFDLYQQGLEAHLNTLKDTAMSVFQDGFDTHTVRDSIDALTGLMQIVDDITKKFGLIPTTVMAASLAFMTFSAKGRELAQSVLFIVPKLGEMVTGMSSAERGAKGLAIGMDVLTGALRTLASATIVGLAFTVITAAFSSATEASMNYNDQQQKIQQQNDQMVSNWQQQGAHIQDLAKQYQSLSQLVSNGKLDANDTQFLQVQQQLAQIVPTVTDHLDAQGNVHLQNADAVNKEVKALQGLSNQQQKLQADKFFNSYTDQSNQLKDAKSQWDTAKQNLDAFNTSPDFAVIKPDSNSFQGIMNLIISQEKDYFSGRLGKDGEKTDLQNDIYDKQQNYNQLLQSENDQLQQSLDTILRMSSGFNDVSDSTQQWIDKLAQAKGIQDFSDANSLAKYKDTAQAVATEMIKLDAQIKQQASNGFGTGGNATQAKLDYIKQLYTEIDKLNSTTFKNNPISTDWLDTVIKQYLGDIQNASNGTYDFSSAISSIKDQYVNATEGVKDLNDAINQQNQGQQLSESTIKTLTDKYPDLKNQIEIVNGQITLSTKALQDQRTTQLQTTQDFIKNKQDEASALAKTLAVQLGVDEKTIQSLQDVAQARELANQAAIPKGLEGIDNSNNLPSDDQRHVAQNQSDLQGFIDLKNEIQQLQQGIDSGFNDGLTKTSASSSTATQQLTKLEQAINDVTNAYQDLQNQMEQYPQHSEQYRDAMQQEIDLLKQKKELLQEQIDNPLTGFNLSSAVQNAAGSTSSTSDQVGQSPFSSSAKLGYTGQYSDVISSAASKYGIDPNLLAAVLQQESGINPLDEQGNIKVSGAGAIGIAQFMPDTAKRYNVDPYDTTSSINGSAHFLSDLLTEFNGNLKLALAGYNAGDKAAQYALSSDDPKYQQTRDYVPSVLSYYQQFSGGQVPAGNSSTDQMKAIADAIQKNKSQIKQINTEIIKAQKAIVDDMLGQYEDVAAKYQDYSKIAQTKMKDMHKGSSDYNGMIDSQLRSLNEQKYLANTEISYINGTQFADFPEYKKKVTDLTASLADYDAQIKQLNQDKLDSDITPLTQENTIIDDTIKKLEQQNQLYKDKNTANVYDPAYITNLNTEITLQNQKVQILQQQNQMIEAQGTLSDANLQTIAQNNQAIADANSAKEQEKLTVANEVVAAMKSGIQEEINAENERHTAFMNNLNEESKAYENQINSQLKQLQDQKSANDYNDQLTTEQKARQKIVDQINALSMDTSVDAKSKRADLQQQLADEDQKILKLQTDREYTVRQQNLQDQLTAYKQDVQNKTDAENDKYNSTKNSLQNQLNDTQHWDQVTKDILSGNVSGIQDEMKQLITGLESYSNTSTNTVDGYFNHVLQRAQEVTTAMNQLTDIANTNNPTSNPIASAQAQVAAYQQQYLQAQKDMDVNGMNNAHVNAIIAASQNGGIYNSTTGTYNWVNPNQLTTSEVQQIMSQLANAWKVASAADQTTLHQIASELGASHGGQYNSASGTWTFPSSIAQMATGAELPLWGSGGKVGILHEGEIVQTKDTAQDIKSVASSAKDFKSIAAKFGNLNITDLANKINLDAMKQSMLPTVSAPNMSGVMSMVNNINNKEGDTHIHLENVTFQGVQDVESGADRLVGRLASQYRKNGGQFRTR